ncbi:hypothetical protein D9M71_722390 [compost metagenome]
MLAEQFQAIDIHFVECLMVVAQAVQYCFAQCWQVFQALAQRWNLDGQYVDAVVQIGSETTLADSRVEIDRGGGDQADVAAYYLVGAHRFELLLLQHAQQLAL